MVAKSKSSESPAVDHRYSIRVAEKPGVPCAICECPTGVGPVAYRDDEPICDLCALDVCVDLGLVLAMVAVSRAFGAVPAWEREASQEGLAQPGAFSRVFELAMGKRWERRGVEFSGQ